jgi:ubiquinone/menaquinone biosynthesis C-methylase UbiE
MSQWVKADPSSREDIAMAYDRIAGEYDTQVQAGYWMRSTLWSSYRRFFRPGQRVLDLSCGTGIDTLFLAQLGLCVVGVDISTRMIEQLEVKAACLGLSDRIQTCVLDVNQLHTWSAPPFDGVISAFAGLSTLPDLSTLADQAARLLKAGGHFIAHMLNRSNIWARLDHVRRGRWGEARRVSVQGTMTANIGGIAVRHYLYCPSEAYRRFFAERFVLCRAYGLGAVRPPVAPRRFSSSCLSMLGVLDEWLSRRPPFINWGQFFVLEMRRRDANRHAGCD